MGHGTARDRRPAGDDRVRPGPREGARRQHQARRPRRHRRRSSSGDAFEQIPKLAGTFDFVFLDAWKKDYKRFFDMVYPRLDARGLFLAHNVVNKRNEMGDFLDVVLKHPVALDDDRVAVRGRNVGVDADEVADQLFVVGAAPRRGRRGGFLGHALLARSWRRGRRPAPVRRSARASTCSSGTSSRRARRTGRGCTHLPPRSRNPDHTSAPPRAPRPRTASSVSSRQPHQPPQV